jgi:hypothetical protein
MTSVGDNRPSHLLTLDYARFSGLLLENAAGSGIELVTIERLLQMTGTPCRLPVPGKIMFPGTGTQPDRRELIRSINDSSFRNAAQLRLWTAFSVRDVSSCLSETLPGIGRTGGDLPDRVVPRGSLDFVDTRFAHRQTHESRNTRRYGPGWLMPDQ